jgi:predicted nucleotidyltransferase
MRLSELQALTPELQVIAKRYGASNLAGFGSVACDEATESSDIDLLVDLPPGISLFQHAEFKLDLEILLRHNVDLIRRRNLKPSLRDRVEADAVPLA